MSVQIVQWEPGQFLVVILDGPNGGRRVFQPSMSAALDYCQRYLRGQA